MKLTCDKSSNYSISHNYIDVVALKNELELLDIPYAVINNPEQPIRLSKVLQYPLKAKPTLSSNQIDQCEILCNPEELIAFFNREDIVVSTYYPLILSLVS